MSRYHLLRGCRECEQQDKHLNPSITLRYLDALEVPLYSKLPTSAAPATLFSQAPSTFKEC